MKENPSATSENIWAIIGLFILALIVRSVVLGFSVDQITVAELHKYSPDVQGYLAAAEAIANSFNFNTGALNTYGPGYPIYLAIVETVFGSNPLVAPILAVLISSLTVLLVSRLGTMVTGDTRIGVGAGLLLALSPTAVGIAGSLLSETLFVFLMVSGILLFVKALEDFSWSKYILAGLFLGYVALTRTVGQSIWVVLVIAATVRSWPSEGFSFRKLLMDIRGPLVMTLVVLSVVGAWSTRNWVLHNCTWLTFAEAHGHGRLTTIVRARRKGHDVAEEWKAYHSELVDSLKVSPQQYETITRIAKRAMINELVSDPVNFASAFVSNVGDQVFNRSLILTYVCPDWKWKVNQVVGQFGRRGYFQFVTILSIVGVFVLVNRGRKEYAMMLFLLAAYFAILSGFTFWQTRRVYFPSQVGTTILISVTLVSLWDWIRLRISNRRDRPLA